MPPIRANIRSSVDEICIDSFLSQINPFLLKISKGEKVIEAEMVENEREADILVRGIMYIL